MPTVNMNCAACIIARGSRFCNWRQFEVVPMVWNPVTCCRVSLPGVTRDGSCHLLPIIRTRILPDTVPQLAAETLGCGQIALAEAQPSLG